ncbi:MAG: TlpA disulfide reductase family protein [Rikenellaceae bacterium]
MLFKIMNKAEGYMGFKNVVRIIVITLFAISCSSNKVKISGTFHGKPNKTLFVEQISPQKRIIDSVKVNSKGEFSYRYTLQSDEPQFINLRLDNSFITLLVDEGEKISVNSIYNIAGGYDVEGSEGSKLVKELNQMVGTVSSQIDSLYTIFNTVSDPEQRQRINQEISQLYIKHKQQSIKFLVKNNKSLVSIMALYQQMPNGIVVFSDPTDFPYYKMLADTLVKKYANSLHVKTLIKDVEKFQSRTALENMVNTSLTNNLALSIPELVMKDMYDKEQKLSSLAGKVTLISFWSVQEQGSAFLNSELKEIYSVYKDKGFEIYQISIDQSKQAWINAITNQKLPWISVNDFQGSASQAVKSYNVTQVPANYLISRSGEIVGKNLFGSDLVSKIAEQF